jgi:hypothetical protein
VVGGGLGVAGVLRVVRAAVVQEAGVGHGNHAAFAVPAVDARPVGVDPADGAVPGSGSLSRLVECSAPMAWAAFQVSMLTMDSLDWLRGPQPLVGRDVDALAVAPAVNLNAAGPDNRTP